MKGGETMLNTREELTVEQLQAISLLVTKPLTGDTFEFIAEKLGVSTHTLWSWRKKNSFNRELRKQSRAIMESHISESYSELIKIINNPNTHDRDKLNAIQLLAKLSGEYEDKHTVELKGPNMTDLMRKLEDKGESG